MKSGFCNSEVRLPFVLDNPAGVGQNLVDILTSPILGRLMESLKPDCSDATRRKCPQKSIPDCAGDALAYQLGSTVTSVSPGPFTLANGKQSNTSNYNYVQYMYQDECTGVNCIALQFCSVVSGSSNPCTGTTLGPDHWLFEDGAASMMAAQKGGNNVIETGSGGATISSTAQLPTHIHFRRYWVHGDWTSLAVGSNAISAG